MLQPLHIAKLICHWSLRFDGNFENFEIKNKLKISRYSAFMTVAK